MRLLHTADWHLGRTLHRVPLLHAQRAVLDHLVDLAREEQVDAILLAGDVFDRALPPVEAVRVAGDALRRLAEVAPVIAISGNHDSAGRLGFAAELIAAGGVHLRTEPTASGDPVVLNDEHGPVAIYGLPYLDPDLARGPLGVEGRSHEAVVGAAMELVRADLAGRDGHRAVVVAHAFVQGGETSESERDISIGGAQTVPPSIFSGADYVALGHLHRPHAVGGGGEAAAEATGTVRYAGSPLPYSFTEADAAKSTAIVDLAADGSTTVRFVAAPAPFRLVRLRGKLDALLTDAAHAEHESEDAWLEVVLTDAQLPARPMERLRARFSQVLVLQHEPEGELSPATVARDRIRGRSDLEILQRFVEDVRGSGPGDDELALLRDAAEQVGRDREDEE